MALAEDGEGHIFVGTVDGLGAVDEKLGVIEIRSTSGSLSSYVSALAFDADERRLWVGTVSDGLSIWSVEESDGLAP